MSAEQFHFSGQHSLRRTTQCLFLAGGCINLERGHFINLRQQDLKALQKVLLPKDSRNAGTKQILKFVIHSNPELKKIARYMVSGERSHAFEVSRRRFPPRLTCANSVPCSEKKKTGTATQKACYHDSKSVH